MLNLIVLRAANVQASVAFYNALGCAFACHRHGEGAEHWAEENGAVVFEIYPGSGEQPATTGLRLGFSVASMQETLALVTNAGGKIVFKPKPSPWGLRAVVTDPDGNRVELTQAQSDAGTSVAL